MEGSRGWFGGGRLSFLIPKFGARRSVLPLIFKKSRSFFKILVYLARPPTRRIATWDPARPEIGSKNNRVYLKNDRDFLNIKGDMNRRGLRLGIKKIKSR